MLMKMKCKIIGWKKDQRGFTLVELVVVMAILVLLGSLAVPQFRTILADAREDANTTNLNMLQNAVDIYISSKGIEPSEVDEFGPIKEAGYLKDDPKPPAGFSAYTVENGVVGGGEKEKLDTE